MAKSQNGMNADHPLVICISYEWEEVTTPNGIYEYRGYDSPWYIKLGGFQHDFYTCPRQLAEICDTVMAHLLRQPSLAFMDDFDYRIKAESIELRYEFSTNKYCPIQWKALSAEPKPYYFELAKHDPGKMFLLVRMTYSFRLVRLFWPSIVCFERSPEFEIKRVDIIHCFINCQVASFSKCRRQVLNLAGSRILAAAAATSLG